MALLVAIVLGFVILELLAGSQGVSAAGGDGGEISFDVASGGTPTATGETSPFSGALAGGGDVAGALFGGVAPSQGPPSWLTEAQSRIGQAWTGITPGCAAFVGGCLGTLAPAGNPNWVPNYNKVGQTTYDTGNLNPGDLVIFKNTYDAPGGNDSTHIGIWEGNGKFIHESGGLVKESNLSDPGPRGGQSPWAKFFQQGQIITGGRR